MLRILVATCFLLFFSLNVNADKLKYHPKSFGKKSELRNFSEYSQVWDVEIGNESDTGWSMQSGGWYPNTIYTFGQSVLVGPSNFYDYTSSCSGRVVHVGPDGIGYPCTFEAKVTPTAAGIIVAHMNTPVTITSANPAPGEQPIQYVMSMKNSIRGIDSPLDSPNPPAGKCPEVAQGSIIRLDSQSLGEVIPIVGTEFNLSYSSEFAESYNSNYGPGRVSFFNPFAWTFDIHRFYRYELWRLYEGSGTSETKRYVETSQTTSEVLSTDGSEIYVFSPEGKHLETKFALTGNIKYSFTYNLDNMISKITDSYGKETLINYSPGVVTIIAPFGQTTSITLAGNLISSVTNMSSETYSLTYKSGTDLLETFTKPGGQSATFTYSSTGRLIKDEGEGGNFWSLVQVLNIDNRQVTKSSAMGRTSVYNFSLNNGDNARASLSPFGLASSTSAHERKSNSAVMSEIESRTTQTAIDKRFGNVAEDFARYTSSIAEGKGNIFKNTSISRTYDPADPGDWYDFVSRTDTTYASGGRSSTVVYTSASRTFFTTTFAGATTTEVRNIHDKPVSIKIGNDTPVNYQYNSYGQLTSISQGTANSVTNTYNAAGLLASTTNARNETTSFIYDLVGRLTQTTRPDSTVVGYSYNANGKLTGITPPGRLKHSFEFNIMELMSKYDPPALSGVAVTETQYNYNLDKQLTSIVRPDTQSVLYTYGATTGLLDKVTLARGDIDYTYLNNTDLVSRIDSADGVRNEYTYNGRDLKSVTQKRSADNFHFADFNFIFDGEHRKIYRAIRGGSYPLYAYIGYSYNNDDKPTLVGSMSLSYSYPSGRLSTTTLDKISDSRTYDSLGNLESYTAYYNPTGGPQQVLYSYTLIRDVMSRIVGKTETIQGVTSTYDYTYDVVGRLIGVLKNSVPYSSYVYDDNGNRTSGMVNGVPFTATYDAQDRLLTYNGRVYSYNANGDNTQIQWDPNTQSSFTYDALGKLISSVSTAGVNFGYSMDGEGNIVRFSQNGSTMVRYIYEDPYRIAGEFTDLGQMYRQYVYGTSVNTPDYTIDATGNNRFIKDHLGSPRLIVNASNGTIMQRMDYDEFGNVIANTNPTYQPYGFAGGIYLRNTGLVKFGARYYNPEVGRWTTKDPILFDGGDTNLYGYVQNDPINFIDPAGEAAVLPLFPVVSLGVGLVVKAYMTYKESQEPFNRLEKMSSTPDIDSPNQCPVPKPRTAPGSFPSPRPSPFKGIKTQS